MSNEIPVFPAYFHLIIKEDCPFCRDAIALVEQTEEPFYVESAEGHGDKWLAEQKHIYKWDTVPIIHRMEPQKDGSIRVKLIGGYTDLREYMNVDEENNQETPEEEQG